MPDAVQMYPVFLYLESVVSFPGKKEMIMIGCIKNAKVKRKW